MKWQYKIPYECDESIYDLPEADHLDLHNEGLDVKIASSLAAENHWHNHDGCEHELSHTYEIDIIYNDVSQGLFKVQVEHDVHFSFGEKIVST